MTVDELSTASEVMAGKFYFAPLRRADGLRSSHIAASSICYSIDDELLFEPFFADFGPLNLGKAYRYCKKTQDLLAEADRTGKRLYHVCGPHANHKANSAVLIGMFQVLFLGRNAEDAAAAVDRHRPFVPFRDASCGVSTFHLTVLDCLRGIQKARDVGFIDWNSGASTWSIDEYEHFEQVENGDLNWIVPGKLAAFSGPASRNNEVPGYRLFTPEDYLPYFRSRRVGAVVRLNKRCYDARRFKDHGVRHFELYFPDGSCPSMAIILRFLEIAEAEPAALAVHCKAGLGRTGVLICAYMMKHYRFTAEECLGYIRIARPGSVIGPQQNFLCEIEARMWAEGDAMRQAGGGGRVGSAAPSSRAAGADVGLGAADMAVSGRAVPAETQHLATSGLAPSAAALASTPAVPPGDMSLLQYTRCATTRDATPAVHLGGTGVQSRIAAGAGAGIGSTSRRSSGRLGGAAGYSSRSTTPLRGSGGSAPSPYGGLLPNGCAAASGGGGGGSGLQLSTSLSAAYHHGPLSAPGYSPAPAVTSVSRSTGSLGLRSGSAVADRSRRNGVGAPGSSSANELRATLHTSTLQASDRPRTNVERNLQSADMTRPSWSRSGGGLRGSGGSGPPGMAGMPGGAPAPLNHGSLAGSLSVPATPVGGSGGGSQLSVTGASAGRASAAVPKHGVVRTLAPNGQPRKVPVAMLSAMRSTGGLRNVTGSVPSFAALQATSGSGGGGGGGVY